MPTPRWRYPAARRAKRRRRIDRSAFVRELCLRPAPSAAAIVHKSGVKVLVDSEDDHDDCYIEQAATEQEPADILAACDHSQENEPCAHQKAQPIESCEQGLLGALHLGNKSVPKTRHVNEFHVQVGGYQEREQRRPKWVQPAHVTVRI